MKEQLTKEYIQAVYEFLFFCDMKWDHTGPTQFYNGECIHYKHFMKAKRGSL